MPDRKFEHALSVKVTSEMHLDIDQALKRLAGTVIRTRAEFLRSMVQYCLDDLADPTGVPVGLEERIRRVRSG